MCMVFSGALSGSIGWLTIWRQWWGRLACEHPALLSASQIPQGTRKSKASCSVFARCRWHADASATPAGRHVHGECSRLLLITRQSDAAVTQHARPIPEDDVSETSSCLRRRRRAYNMGVRERERARKERSGVSKRKEHLRAVGGARPRGEVAIHSRHGKTVGCKASSRFGDGGPVRRGPGHGASPSGCRWQTRE